VEEGEWKIGSGEGWKNERMGAMLVLPIPKKPSFEEKTRFLL
jgi:hypothetical protein